MNRLKQACEFSKSRTQWRLGRSTYEKEKRQPKRLQTSCPIDGGKRS
jgi:hypothetical protein